MSTPKPTTSKDPQSRVVRQSALPTALTLSMRSTQECSHCLRADRKEVRVYPTVIDPAALAVMDLKDRGGGTDPVVPQRDGVPPRTESPWWATLLGSTRDSPRQSRIRAEARSGGGTEDVNVQVRVLLAIRTAIVLGALKRVSQIRSCRGHPA